MRSPFQWWDRTVSLSEQRSWEYFLDRLRLLRRLAAAAELSLAPDTGEAACPKSPRVFERRENSTWALDEGNTPQDLAVWLEAEFAREVLERAHRFASGWEARLLPAAHRRLGAERIREIISELSSTGRRDDDLPEEGLLQPASSSPGRLRPLWGEFLALPELQLLESRASTEHWGAAIPGRLSDRTIEAEAPCCADLLEASLDPLALELASEVRHLRMLGRLESAIRQKHSALAPGDAGPLRCELSLRRSPHDSGLCRLEIRSRD